MNIDMERATELSRDKMHSAIKQCSNLTDSNVVKASEDLDKKVLEEMLAQDPKIENIYLKNVIKSKDQRIRELQDKLFKATEKERRMNDIIESAVMKFECGMMAINAIDLAVKQAREEGLTI